MSQSHPLHFSSPSRRREVWRRVDVGVYRGTRVDGRILGEVHTVSGGHVAIDASGVPVGRYATRDHARRALRTVVVLDPARPRPDRAERLSAGMLGVRTATVLGGVALAGALTAAAAAPWL